MHNITEKIFFTYGLMSKWLTQEKGMQDFLLHPKEI